MTVDTAERTQLDTAYRALYLLPSAPRELVYAAYAALEREGHATASVRRAYEAIVAAPDMADAYILPRRTSPWEVLHLCADAPDAVSAAAYDLWRGDAEPMDAPAPRVGPPKPKADAATYPREMPERFVYSFEELHDMPSGSSFTAHVGAPASDPFAAPLLDGTEEIEQPQAEAFAYIYEEFAGEAMAGPGETVEPEEETGARLTAPMLIDRDGAETVLSDRPLRIGTQPSCNIVVQAGARVEARVWRNKGRVLVHALGEPGLVLVNGRAATWGVLSDGDTLAVGPAAFDFRAQD